MDGRILSAVGDLMKCMLSWCWRCLLVLALLAGRLVGRIHAAGVSVGSAVDADSTCSGCCCGSAELDRVVNNDSIRALNIG